MGISNDQKVDLLWKKVGYGRAKTDVNSIKNATNESIEAHFLSAMKISGHNQI